MKLPLLNDSIVTAPT